MANRGEENCVELEEKRRRDGKRSKFSRETTPLLLTTHVSVHVINGLKAQATSLQSRITLMRAKCDPQSR